MADDQKTTGWSPVKPIVRMTQLLDRLLDIEDDLTSMDLYFDAMPPIVAPDGGLSPSALVSIAATNVSGAISILKDAIDAAQS